MKATTMYINYEPGEFYITQGHKGYEKRHQNKAGRYVNPTGFGWGTESKPSRISVGIEIDGKKNEVFVDRYFKDNWGRLTSGRVSVIKKTLPDELEVIKNTQSGNVYYTVDDKSMESWLFAAENAKFR